MVNKAEPPRKKARSSGPSLLSHTQVLAIADERPSIIRVRDLQVTLKGPMDAWGRTGKQQPALVSVEVRMREPFGESSEKDEVAGDTVHYGLLAKGIMAKIQETEEQECLMGYMITLWRKLVGYVDLSCVMQFLGDAGEALLKKEQVAYVRVSIKMTKASLLGEGVSMDWAAAFLEDTTARGMEAAASSMKVHGLRIPTLVGVNANERTAKQIVLANVWVEKMLGVSEDFHPDFEAVVTQAISESSFETLEALAQFVLEKLKAKYAESWKENVDATESGPWLFGIELQKPIAVPFAEAPCVELKASAE